VDHQVIHEFGFHKFCTAFIGDECICFSFVTYK